MTSSVSVSLAFKGYMSVIFTYLFQINQPKTATVASSRKSTSQVRRLSKDQKFAKHESLRLASHLENEQTIAKVSTSGVNVKLSPSFEKKCSNTNLTIHKLDRRMSC